MFEGAPTEDTSSTEQTPEAADVFSFYKGKEGDEMPENPNMVFFKPSKEHYDNPEELVHEYREFIAHDLEDGQVVQVEGKHLRQMAEYEHQQQREAMEQQKAQTEKDKAFERVEYAEMNREQLLQIFLEQVSLSSLIFFSGLPS